jgi:hypothetical protein
MTIDTAFRYDALSEARENYLDQIAEVIFRYRTADLKHAHPEVYIGEKLGGNPVRSVPHAESDI